VVKNRANNFKFFFLLFVWMDEYILFCTNDRIGKAGDENLCGLSKMSKTNYTAQQKTGPFFPQAKFSFFMDFQLLITTPFLVFFLSTSDFWDNPQWIFQKHWKCPNWVTPKRYNKIFPKIQSIRGFFSNKCYIQNWFWNLSSTSGLSQIWKIWNAWKLPSACLKDNSDP
jgi:hypothetical protein